MKHSISIILFIIILLLLFPPSVAAHKSSDSYLSLDFSAEQPSGQWDISLKDLEFAIGLDQNGDGKITWKELREKHSEINDYALSRLSLKNNLSECSTSINSNLLDHHTDGAYTVLRFIVDCDEEPNAISIDYSLFFDFDRQHRGLIKVITDQDVQSYVLGPNDHQRTLSLNQSNHWLQFSDFVKQGITHIFIGIDHILFLLSLLLPAVFYRHKNQWLVSSSIKDSLTDVTKIVTAFTLAHSLTLGLAIFNLIYMPSRLAESIIALSVIVVAANNIFPMITGQQWKIAFAFGLIHGFGFASVLQDLNIENANLALSLVGFNIGVELGQLAIVGTFLPLAYLIRRHWFYKKLIFQFGSIAIIGISVIWLLERSLDLEILAAPRLLSGL